MKRSVAFWPLFDEAANCSRSFSVRSVDIYWSVVDCIPYIILSIARGQCYITL